MSLLRVELGRAGAELGLILRRRATLAEVRQSLIHWDDANRGFAEITKPAPAWRTRKNNTTHHWRENTEPGMCYGECACKRERESERVRTRACVCKQTTTRPRSKQTPYVTLCVSALSLRERHPPGACRLRRRRQGLHLRTVETFWH